MKRKQIEKAFSALADRLKKQGIKGEIGVVGGAAMVLAYKARAATKDVDAIFYPSEVVRKEAEIVARKQGLPLDWLNDAVKGFLPSEPNKKLPIFDFENLSVWVPPAEYLLAMKSISARLDSNDGADIKTLCKVLKLKNVEQVLEVVAEYYPKNRVPARTVFFLEEIFEN